VKRYGDDAMLEAAATLRRRLARSPCDLPLNFL